MKRFVLGLSIGLVTLATAALAQTDPNTPTGPNNPNPPTALTGQQTPMPCGPSLTSNGAGATAPTTLAAQPQGAPGNPPASVSKDKPSAAGCSGQDHPAGGSGSAPATTPHP